MSAEEEGVNKSNKTSIATREREVLRKGEKFRSSIDQATKNRVEEASSFWIFNNRQDKA